MPEKKRKTLKTLNRVQRRSGSATTKAVKALKKAATAAETKVGVALAAKTPTSTSGGSLDANGDAKRFFKELKTTADVRLSDSLIDQIIGQERGRKIIRKAATQKRNVLLVGYPGTGKSMLAQAMAELLPVEELQDILVKPNPVEENAPVIEVVKAGEGKKKIEEERMKKQLGASNLNLVYVFFIFIVSFLLLSFGRKELGDVITAALLIGLFAIGGLMMLGAQLGRGRLFAEGDGVKLLVDNSDKKKAPFIEATGARAGALLGDVRHDPFQSIVDGRLFVKRGKRFVEVSFESLWRKFAVKYPALVERREDGYEALALPLKEKVFVLCADARGKVVAARVHSLNRRFYDGEVIEVNVGKNKITTTPEHSFVLKSGNKTADKLKKGDVALVLEKLGLAKARAASC
ncbi:MAG: ATP-binding protein [Candidatus Norongarragalinales archaeon]